VLPAGAEEFFRLDRVVVASEATLEAGFAVILVAKGELVVGESPAPRGTTFVAAAEDGVVRVSGAGEVLVARPPAP
jgi:mannose-6-phosphate isomerase